jgi:peptidyl-dipeptidase Dcp
MLRATLGLFMVVICMTASASSPLAADPQAAGAQDPNPLLTQSTLPFQAIPFDKIKDAHFKPAFEEGMRQQLAEVNAIADSAAAPTFDNTLVALEKTGQTLLRAQLAFNTVMGANTNDGLQKFDEEMSPKLSAHNDTIYMNTRLFTRIDTLYNRRAQLRLDQESLRLLEVTHQNFVMAGARLSDADKAKLKKLNEEDAGLSSKFANTLLGAAKDAALVISDKAELAGLSDADLDAAAQAAKARNLEGKWVLTLRNTTQQPLLESLTNRATREKLFNASVTRASRGGANDTRDIIRRQAEIRAEKAGLLDQPSFAAWNLQNQMAKTPQRVQQFLDQLVPATIAKARVEAADIQALIDRQGGGFKLQPWDWDFYAAQVRRARFDLDTEQIKPYFELNRVLKDGVFYAAQELYGLTFRERKDLPVYHPDVQVYDVLEADGSQLALFYGDFYKRDNKNGGAWMDNMVVQSKLLGTKPIIYNVSNFTKPSPGQPTLILWDDVNTLFHEFGHTLHGLFADQTYPTLSGTSTARDFVEFPSQFNEHWALEPRVFANYAKHYQTGAPMPADLVEKIKRSIKFNQGYALTEVVAAASLDMQWHTLRPGTKVADADKFEVDALARARVHVPEVPPRYHSPYFLHIWANGYYAGYYAYLWTEMLDDDAYAWFQENGGMTRANGKRFRDMILSRGNTDDYAKMFREFRGRDPIIEPMLEHRGLKEDTRRPGQ